MKHCYSRKLDSGALGGECNRDPALCTGAGLRVPEPGREAGARQSFNVSEVAGGEHPRAREGRTLDLVAW